MRGRLIRSSKAVAFGLFDPSSDVLLAGIGTGAETHWDDRCIPQLRGDRFQHRSGRAIGCALTVVENCDKTMLKLSDEYFYDRYTKAWI
jgi:hypothetical protein